MSFSLHTYVFVSAHCTLQCTNECLCVSELYTEGFWLIVWLNMNDHLDDTHIQVGCSTEPVSG